MKSKFLLLFLSLFMVVGGVKAGGDYYSKMKVVLEKGSTGRGLVYVGHDQRELNEAQIPYSKESEDTGKSGSNGGNVDYYLYAKANPGYKFNGWYSDFTCNTLKSNSAYSYNAKVSAKSNDESKPTTETYYAKFDQLKEVSNNHTLWYSESDVYPQDYVRNGDNMDAVEVFSGNNNFTQGKQLYQKLTGLKNGYYKITWTAAASHANGAQGIKDGADIAERYVVSGEKDVLTDPMTVWVQSNTELTADKLKDFTHTDIVQVTDETLEYGIRNKAVGGNWYVCKAEKLEYLGDTKATLSCKAEKYSTFVAPFEVSLKGVTAYTVDDVQNGWVVLGDVESENGVTTIDANTPVIIKNAATSEVSEELYGNMVSGTPSNEYLTGVYTVTSVPAGNYVLQTKDGKQGFFKVEQDNTINCGYNKCYLNGGKVKGVKAFFLSEDDATTAIDAVEALINNDVKIYDMNGRRLNALQKGVNIVNGKKVLVK